MVHWRWLGLCIAAIAYFIAIPSSTKLRLDRSLEAMFPEGSQVRTDFERLESIFGVSELVVFVYRDANLWNRDGSGIDRLKKVRTEIETIPGIQSVMDLSKLDAMLSTFSSPVPLSLGGVGFGKLSPPPVVDPENAFAAEFVKLFDGQTHSRESDLVALACILKPKGDPNSPANYRTLLSRLRQVDVGGEQVPMLVGQRVMLEEGFDEIEHDGERLSFYVAFSLTLLLTIGFGSLRWALIAIWVVHWSLTITNSILVVLDWELTMVSSMLASIVTVIAIATSMHWLLAYQRLTAAGVPPEDAMAESYSALRAPILWACITDAIGFAALAFSDVGPVQDYGWMMAIASMVVLAGILLWIPGLALLPLLPKTWERKTLLEIPLQPRRWLQNDWCRPALLTVQRWVGRHAIAVIWIATGTGLLGLIGSFQIEVETDFVKNFRQRSPLATAYRVVENELGGAGVWDVVIPIPTPTTEDTLSKIRTLEEKLRSLEVVSEPTTNESQSVKLTSVLSIVDADDVAASKPWLKAIGWEGRLLGMRPVMGDFFQTLVADHGPVKHAIPNSDPIATTRYLRVMLRSREQAGAREKRMLIQAVRMAVMDSGLQLDTVRPGNGDSLSSSVSPFVSGYYVLLAELVSSLVADQWICFFAASFGIWIAMAIALRDPALALLAWVPNAIPSLCVLGWFGWANIPINLGAAMIAAVSMGLSVDSSLHYLIRFQRELKSGSSFQDSVQAAQSEVGLSVILSTLALMLGFGALSASDFLPTVVFGITSSLTMFGGLLGNLLLLPALLYGCYPKLAKR